MVFFLPRIWYYSDSESEGIYASKKRKLRPRFDRKKPNYQFLTIRYFRLTMFGQFCPALISFS